ncbi:ankyrin repeat-containing domain protein [Thelonectria olida]|uniref:Ankyrin repeat-containing domain protein n=1 Tax=Thelonectria olida TaxID=1576542 RepID=A0A9P8VNC5_9HYPO|nr:ankyrin repeat-containing domain protein [Thelonectria olida]
MALLLNKRGAEIHITEDVLKAAVGNERSAEVVALLLTKRGIDTIAAITDNVCFTAAASGQLDALRFLCQQIPPKTVDPSWNSIARFYHAAEHGDVDRVKQLLQEPIPTDTKNSRGQTPLWIAAFNRRTDVVKILAREKNVNVDSLSASGQSPIFWPSAYGYEDVVDILVSVGAKSHFIDANGRTAVSMARQNGHERIVRVLDAQSAQRRESVSVGHRLWWRRLLLCAALIFLGFIFGAGMLDKYHQTRTPENSGAGFCLFRLG